MNKRLLIVALSFILLLSVANPNVDARAAPVNKITTSSSGTGRSFCLIPGIKKGKNVVTMSKCGVYIKYIAPKSGTYSVTMSNLKNAETLYTDIRFGIKPKSMYDLKKKDIEVVALCESRYAKKYRYTGYMKTSGVKFRLMKGESVYIFLSYGRLLNKKNKVSCNITIKS